MKEKKREKELKILNKISMLSCIQSKSIIHLYIQSFFLSSKLFSQATDLSLLKMVKLNTNVYPFSNLSPYKGY